MAKFLVAAAAAFALLAATPARACGEECKNCPKMAQAAEKKEGQKPAACACAGEGKECKCGEKCGCPHCHAAKTAKEEKKS